MRMCCNVLYVLSEKSLAFNCPRTAAASSWNWLPGCGWPAAACSIQACRHKSSTRVVLELRLLAAGRDHKLTRLLQELLTT